MDDDRYRRMVVGESDRTLFPLVRPGAAVLVDTQERRIASRREFTNDFDRPIYMVEIREGFVCCWCDMKADHLQLTIVSHPLSDKECRSLPYPGDIHVVGRVVQFQTKLGSQDDELSN